MSQRPPRPEGFPWLSPYLTVRDGDASLDFYQKAFGFEKRMAHAGPDGKTSHAEMTWRDSLFMLGAVSEAKAKEWPCRPPDFRPRPRPNKHPPSSQNLLRRSLSLPSSRRVVDPSCWELISWLRVTLIFFVEKEWG